MILRDFLAAFKTPDTQVTVYDGDTELITFKASGYQHLDDELEERNILQWQITAPIALKIKLVPETSN